MTRRAGWLVVLAGVALTAAWPGRVDAAAKPNVLIVLADDEGWGDLSVNGNTNISTPNIDSLSKDGTLLDRFYVCAVCSPTRAEFLTGRYHPQMGVHSTSTGGERMDLGEKTIAESFKAAGYSTGAFGKWHNGTQWPYHPNARGFDEYYGFTSGHWGLYFDTLMDHNGQLTTGKGFIIDDLTDHAMKFMEENVGKDKPFFCYVPFNTPHFPCQVPDPFWSKFAKADIKMRATNPNQEEVEVTRAILAMTANIDWNVGRLLKKLDEMKIAENTIVIYFSDNGPNSWRWNGGMKGRKGSVDEGGVRSPFMIRWPGHIKAGQKVPQIAGAIDLLPTLTDLCGVQVVSTKKLNGISLKSLLTGQEEQRLDRMIFNAWARKLSVRTQRFRLDDGGALYDMVADPGQTKDVSKQHPDVASKLAKAAADWKKEMKLKAARDEDDRPFLIGYGKEQFPLTQLPARDGWGHGNVKRSASAPNCSFFTGWSSAGDSITWDVEVGTAGKYEAVILYTCPAADVGSTIEMSLNGSKVEAKITEAFDPPLVGAKIDRVQRHGESYVKDWKPLKLGTIDLKPGRGELTLRAKEVAGKHVADVRMVMLTLVK